MTKEQHDYLMAACQRMEGKVEKASPWIERPTRVGYAAHGTVYALVGVLALRAASGAGQTANQEGALRWVLLAPAGTCSTTVRSVPSSSILFRLANLKIFRI